MAYLYFIGYRFAVKTLSSLSFLLVVSKSDEVNKLERCLKSINSQNSKFKELVIVKNGSLTRQHIKLINEFKPKKFKKTIVYSQRPLNLGPALNLGLKKIKSTYILRIDPDDINLRNRVKIVKNGLSNSNHDLGVYGVYEKNLTKLVKVNKFKKTTLHENLKILNPIFHSSVVIKTSTLNELGGYRDVPYAEDYDLWLRLILNDKKIKIFKRTVVIIDNEGVHKRRRNLNSLKGEFAILALKNKIYSNFIFNILIFLSRIIYKLIPSRMMSYIYGNFILKSN
jgi:glycosyltransferase involved in cell wall biosynthesis